MSKLIINTDNFDGDYPNESIVAEIRVDALAPVIAKALNAWAGPNSARYYKVEDMGYVLQPGFEP